MEHLTTDEILNFVSMTELNSKSIKLSATVNGHIRKCEECLKLVRSFQLIYDEFSRLGMSGDFKNFVSEKLSEKEQEKSTFIENMSSPDEFDGLR